MRQNTRAFRPFVAVPLALALAFPAAAADSTPSADSAPTASRGKRVRIGRTGQPSLVGRLVEVGPDSVTVDARPPRCVKEPQEDCASFRKSVVPRADIRRIDVSVGKRRYPIVLGATIGATAGIALTLASGGGECYEKGSYGKVFTRPCEETFGGAIYDDVKPFMAGVSALLLGMLGGLFGALFATDKWRGARLEHVSMEVQPVRGGGRLAVRLRF